MRNLMTALLVTGAILMAALPAMAKNEGKLPKGAAAMETAAVEKHYAGKSINWGNAQAYWAPDKTMIGYFSEKGKEGFAEGAWKVTGNEMCYEITWRGVDKSKPPFVQNKCAKLYMAGKKVWIENSRDDEQWQGDIWTGQEKKMKKSDIVTKNAMALKKQLGY